VSVGLDSRQQRFAVGLANLCSTKLRKLPQDPCSGTPVYRAVKEEQKHGLITKCMYWPAPGTELVLRTTILDDTTTAKRAVRRWDTEVEAKVGAGMLMWSTDGSCSDDGQVGAAELC